MKPYNTYKKYCESYHPMEYKGDGYSKVIARGKYKGFTFLVINNKGMLPCGYVNVKGTKYENKDYEKLSLKCHGGLTYSEKEILLTGETGWWLGWDYGHFGDRIEYENKCLSFLWGDIEKNKKLKSWKTGEVVKECLNVIEQIVKK